MQYTSVSLSLLILLSLPTLSVMATCPAETTSQTLTPEEIQELEMIEAFIQNVKEKCEPFFACLANTDLSDEEIIRFTEERFDQAPEAQLSITRENLVTAAQQIHSVIQILEYNEHVDAIMYNLKRIGKISTNKHVAALVEYLEENNIDLGDPNACIE